MKNTDLFNLLGTFTNSEFENFGKFLNSPYNNSIKILTSFYICLIDFYPDFSHNNFTKENLFHTLFNGKEYNDGVMRNLFSDMKKKAEEFLVFESLKNDDFLSRRIILSETRSRNLEKSFLKVFHKLKEDFGKSMHIDGELFLKKYIASNEFNSLLLENKINYKTEILSGNLEDMLNNLMHYATTQTLRIYIQFFILKRGVPNCNFDFKFMEEIESIYGKLEVNSSGLFYPDFVHSAFKLFQTGNKEYYCNLLNIKDKHIDLLSDQDKSNLYNTLIIISYDYIVKGELGYIKTLFEIMKEYVGKKLYREDSLDNIPEFAYLNILSIGIFANEISWTEKFYQSHIKKLVIYNRENLEMYSLALIAYSKKEYDKALENLARISTKKFSKIDLFTIKYKIKSLQLKIFYDINQQDLFFSCLDAMKHFAYNDRLSVESNRFIVLDFIKFTGRLFLIKNSRKKNLSYEKMKLHEEILKENVIIDKIWLLKKIEELK